MIPQECTQVKPTNTINEAEVYGGGRENFRMPQGVWALPWTAPTSKSTAIAVYAALAAHADRDGVCYPSIGTIATMTGLGRRAVTRAIHDLGVAGWIASTPSAESRANHYQLLVIGTRKEPLLAAKDTSDQRTRCAGTSAPGARTSALGARGERTRCAGTSAPGAHKQYPDNPPINTSKEHAGVFEKILEKFPETKKSGYQVKEARKAWDEYRPTSRWTQASKMYDMILSHAAEHAKSAYAKNILDYVSTRAWSTRTQAAEDHEQAVYDTKLATDKSYGTNEAERWLAHMQGKPIPPKIEPPKPGNFTFLSPRNRAMAAQAKAEAEAKVSCT